MCTVGIKDVLWVLITVLLPVLIVSVDFFSILVICNMRVHEKFKAKGCSF